MKLLFIPFSVVGGFAAGFLGKKVFEQVWGLIDEEEPPGQEHRDAPWPKVLVALALQGAVFTLARGVVDRSARIAFYRLTGTWPGEQQPDPE